MNQETSLTPEQIKLLNQIGEHVEGTPQHRAKKIREMHNDPLGAFEAMFGVQPKSHEQDKTNREG